MKPSWIAPLALLIACGASAQLPTTATISVDATGDDPETPVFTTAVAEALTARGFTLIEGAGHASLVAHVSVSRAQVGTSRVKAPADRPTGGPGGAAGVGMGASFSLPTGKSNIVPLQRTKLTVRMTRRGETADVWHSAASTVRPVGLPRGTASRTASDLAEAALRIYPTQAQDDISIP